MRRVMVIAFVGLLAACGSSGGGGSSSRRGQRRTSTRAMKSYDDASGSVKDTFTAGAGASASSRGIVDAIGVDKLKSSGHRAG